MPKLQNLQLLLQKKEKIDKQINQIKEQNIQSLASSLNKISEIEMHILPLKSVLAAGSPGSSLSLILHRHHHIACH